MTGKPLTPGDQFSMQLRMAEEERVCRERLAATQQMRSLSLEEFKARLGEGDAAQEGLVAAEPKPSELAGQ